MEVANREEVRVNGSADVQLQGLGIQHIRNPPLHSALSQLPLPASVGSGHPIFLTWALPTSSGSLCIQSVLLSSPALSLSCRAGCSHIMWQTSASHR